MGRSTRICHFAQNAWCGVFWWKVRSSEVLGSSVGKRNQWIRSFSRQNHIDFCIARQKQGLLRKLIIAELCDHPRLIPWYLFGPRLHQYRKPLRGPPELQSTGLTRSTNTWPCPSSAIHLKSYPQSFRLQMCDGIQNIMAIANGKRPNSRQDHLYDSVHHQTIGRFLAPVVCPSEALHSSLVPSTVSPGGWLFLSDSCRHDSSCAIRHRISHRYLDSS